jgi:hypothetical protein
MKSTSVLSINSLDDLILNLIIKMNGKVIEVPTMFEKIQGAEVLFNIPLYEANDDLFYPLKDKDEDNENEYDYCETGYLTISDFEEFMKLLKGEQAKIQDFVGKYSKSSELEKLIKNGKITIISQ